MGWGHRAHTPHARRVCSIARYVYRCTVPTGLHSSQAGYWGYQDHALRAERDSKMGSVLTFCPRADCISFGRFSRHSKQTHGGATAQSTGCHPHVRRNPHRKIVRMHCEPHGSNRVRFTKRGRQLALTGRRLAGAESQQAARKRAEQVVPKAQGQAS